MATYYVMSKNGIDVFICFESVGMGYRYDQSSGDTISGCVISQSLHVFPTKCCFAITCFNMVCESLPLKSYVGCSTVLLIEKTTFFSMHVCYFELDQ